MSELTETQKTMLKAGCSTLAYLSEDAQIAAFDQLIARFDSEHADQIRQVSREQKLAFVRKGASDPQGAVNDLKVAVFDNAVLKDHPEMRRQLSTISAEDKLRLLDEPEPQRTEDIKTRIFDASMQDMYAKHPDLKEKIDKIPRDRKLQLIDAIGEGMKQDPQLLEHVNQAMQDHPQAFNTAINALMEDPSKKNQLIGLIAADQMQHKIVDMFGGPNSAIGKVVNWIFNFLIDGPLGGFMTGIFGTFAGAMGGLQGSASRTQPDGQPALRGVSTDFEIAHTAIHGSVEDTNTGKVYHLRGELNNEEKAELNAKPEIKYNYDRAANETTIRSTNRNWSLPMPAHA